MRLMTHRNGEKGCYKPGCHEWDEWENGKHRPPPKCTCPDNSIVPVGFHTHHHCPRHGELIIRND